MDQAAGTPCALDWSAELRDESVKALDERERLLVGARAVAVLAD